MDRGSEDFGWYTKKIDGAVFHIGAGENHAELHTGAFDFPDDLTEKISDVFCEIVKMFKWIYSDNKILWPLDYYYHCGYYK